MTDTNAGKKRGWGKIVLVISLALNLLVVGLIAGAWWSGGPKHGGGFVRGGPGAGGFSPYARALSERDRKATRSALRGRSEALRQSREAMREEGAMFMKALTAEPFDITEIENIFEGQQSRALERVVLGQSVLLERIGAMSDAERAAYAERVAEELKRKPRRKGDRKGPKPPKD